MLHKMERGWGFEEKSSCSIRRLRRAGMRVRLADPTGLSSNRKRCGASSPRCHNLDISSMKRKLPVIAFAALSSLALAAPAAAQPSTSAIAQQSSVKIVYEPPTNTKFTPIYERLKQRRVLEELQAFMAPLRLPRELTVRIAQCGSQNLPYKPQGPATVCYELIDQIERKRGGES